MATGKNILTEPLNATFPSENVALGRVLADHVVEELLVIVLQAVDGGPCTSNVGSAFPNNLCEVTGLMGVTRFVEVIQLLLKHSPGATDDRGRWKVVFGAGRNVGAKHIFTIRTKFASLFHVC